MSRIISYEEAMELEVGHPHPSEKLPMYKEADERGDCSLLLDTNGGNCIEVLCRIEDIGEETRGKRIGLLIVPYEREIAIWTAIECREGEIDGGMSVCEIDDIHTPLDTIIAKAKAEMNKCPVCGKAIPITKQERFSFAGRCCPDCLPEMKRQHEYPGWYN